MILPALPAVGQWSIALSSAQSADEAFLLRVGVSALQGLVVVNSRPWQQQCVAGSATVTSYTAICVHGMTAVLSAAMLAIVLFPNWSAWQLKLVNRVVKTGQPGSSCLAVQLPGLWPLPLSSRRHSGRLSVNSLSVAD